MSHDNTVSARAPASRRNGARSQGPRTAAGKARTARNALKHGLRARRLARRSGATSGGRPWEPAALDDENASEFRAFQAAAQAELAPSRTLQSELVERIVTAACGRGGATASRRRCSAAISAPTPGIRATPRPRSASG